MTEVTFRRIAVGGLVTAGAALILGSVAYFRLGQFAVRFEQLIKSGRFTTDDQPVTLGGGSLHLHPSTGWETRAADADHPTNYLKHTSDTVDYTHVDWACSDDVDTATVNMRASPQATVALVYAGPGSRSHTLTFKKESARVLTLTIITEAGASVPTTMFRHLLEFGESGKSKWKYASFTSTGMFSDAGTSAEFTCPPNPANNEGDFFLQFRQ